MFKNKYRIESIRLPGYDYSRPGAYFITIVVHNRQCLFGEIVNGEMTLNEFGEIVKTEWQKTGALRPNIDVDAFVVMPNHLHGILIITDNDDLYHHHNRNRNRDRNRRDTLQRVSTESESESESESGMGMEPGMGMGTIEQFGKPTHNSIPTIVRLFKSTVTKQINQIRQTLGIPVWQRNYYEHIIRNDDELNKIREYIINNPLTWKTDENHV
ncbi:MAG: transposase [Candidatus Marinimicrobia bacterium]|nr:transposase [Candidatus Neomarinimicrobiota bacterium]